MIHPDVELRHCSASVGSGLFATAPIPRGTIVYVLDELEVVLGPGDPRLAHPVYGPLIDRYSYRDAQGRLIMSWDLARYENHSCDANTLSTGYGFEIAIRDIDAGEEVTDDYGLFNMTAPLHCQCGSPRCRGLITGNDPNRLHRQWDSAVKGALACLRTVPQPLGLLIDAATDQALNRFLETGRGYRSVRQLRYHNGTPVDHPPALELQLSH